MLHFSVKFIASMLQSCFKEICLVLTGMVLCLCLLINYGDSLFDIQNNYGGTVTDEEAVMYLQNRIIFTFSNVDKMDEVLNQVAGLPGVYGAYMDSYIGRIEVQCGTRLPLIEENTLLTGSIPEKLSNGQVISSHDLLQGLMRESVLESDPGEDVIIVDSEGVELEEREFLEKDEILPIAGKDFVNIAEVSSLEGHVVTIDDFMELYQEAGSAGSGRVYFSYVYEKGFTEKQKKEVEELVASIKQPEDIYVAGHAANIKFSVFTELSREEILGLVIASLNALFLYAYLLKKRIPVYTILKLQGFTNGKLRGMLLIEFLLVYLAACLLSAIVYGGFAMMVGRAMAHTKEIYLYSIACMFVVNLVLFLLVTWRLVRKQPFELYQGKE